MSTERPHIFEALGEVTSRGGHRHRGFGALDANRSRRSTHACVELAQCDQGIARQGECGRIRRRGGSEAHFFDHGACRAPTKTLRLCLDWRAERAPANPRWSEARSMELDLTSDQEILRATTARFISEACPLAMVRQIADGTSVRPSDYVSRAAELGWFALLVPEQHGGGSVSGDGLRDLALIAEERGRVLQPGPFVSMNVVAAALVAAGSTAQQALALGPICRGEVVATWAVGGGLGGGSDAVITVSERGGDFELSGRAAVVQGGVGADWLLVTADGREGSSQFLVAGDTPGISARPLGGLDITQEVSSVEFEHVVVQPSSVIGAHGGGGEDVERQLELACVLTAVETVGALDVLFEMTRRYAIERIAFGRPIGSFQAVKHQLADMSLSLECAKAITADAVRAVQAGDADAGEIVSMAKWWVGDTGIDIAQGCFQLFGGIGFTWQHDLHLFLRRITTNSILFGQPDWHRERICRLHGL